MHPLRQVPLLFGALCLSVLAGQTQTSPPTGGITGWVLGTDGKPLAGVLVLINSRSDMVHPATPFNSSAATVGDGSFTLTGVPDGTYSVCPHPPNPSLLAPCNWDTEPRVKVANGKRALLSPAIKLQLGVDFYVRVNDPNGTRAAAEGKTDGAALLIAVRAPNGRVFPIPMTTRDTAGFDHHLSVPAGADLVFTAFSKAFSMTDNQGKAMGKQDGPSATTVNIPPGQTQHKEVINIH